MDFKQRRDWKEGRPITKGRSRGGKIILKKLGVCGRGHLLDPDQKGRGPTGPRTDG